MLCDGKLLNTEEFRPLFKAIGFTYGKETRQGATFFYSPDYRGQFLRGVTGDAEDPDSRDPAWTERTAMFPGGESTGNRVGSVQPDAIEEHTHFMGYKVTFGALARRPEHGLFEITKNPDFAPNQRHETGRR